MLKKLISVFLCITCLASTLTGCGNSNVNPESRNISNFVAVANSLNMPIVVVEPETDDIQNIYIAVSQSSDKSKILWQIEHYEMVDEEKAKTLFDSLTAEKEKSLGEPLSIKEKSGLTSAMFTTEETYLYLERVGNILILAEIPVEHKPSVTSFVEELENTLGTES